MAIKITNPTMTNVGTAIQVSHGSKLDIEVNGGEFRDVKTFFNERDPLTLYEYVGLPADAPREDVRELLLELVRQQGNPSANAEQVVKASKLWGYIEHAKNAASMLEKLVSVANKGAEFIARLPLQ